MPKIYRTSAESNPSCDSVWRKRNWILTDLSFNMNYSIHLFLYFYLMRIYMQSLLLYYYYACVYYVDWLTTVHSCGYDTPTHLCIVCLYVVCAPPCTNKQTRLQSTRLGENGDFKIPRQGRKWYCANLFARLISYCALLVCIIDFAWCRFTF